MSKANTSTEETSVFLHSDKLLLLSLACFPAKSSFHCFFLSSQCLKDKKAVNRFQKLGDCEVGYNSVSYTCYFVNSVELPLAFLSRFVWAIPTNPFSGHSLCLCCVFPYSPPPQHPPHSIGPASLPDSVTGVTASL